MALVPYPSLATLPEVIANGGKMPAHSIDVFAARTVYASSIPGVKLDCNLATGAKIGGGTATDNAAAFNAVLATATAANPVHLIIDGPAAVGAALNIPDAGHVAISGHGWSTGFFWLSGSNCNQIQSAVAGTTNLSNNNAVHPSAPQTNVGSHVTLSNFFMNCNRGTFPNGLVNNNPPDGTLSGIGSPDAKGWPAKFFYTSVILIGLDQVAIDRVFVYDSPSYHINLYGCTNVKITRCKIQAAVANVQNNTDGIHVNGGCSGITIDDCDFQVGDDSVAVNVAEGDATGGDLITVTNCRVNSLTIGRILGKSTATLGRAVFSNITGSVQWYGFVVGESGSTDATPESNRSILLDKISVNVLGLAGRTDYAMALVSGNAGVLDVNECRFVNPTVACPMVRMDVNSPLVSSLRITNCAIHRGQAGNAAAYAFEGSQSGSSIGELVIEGFKVTEQSGHAYSDIPALANLDGTTVGHVTADARVKGVAKVLNVTANSAVGGITASNLDHASNAGSPASYSIVAATASGTIPVSVGRYTGTNLLGLASGAVALTGPGLVSSGFAFPDAMIADGSLFQSSTQSKLCFKAAGTATPFTMGTPPPATGYSLTGPSSGTVGVDSTIFTVTPNGTVSGTLHVTITPSGGGLSTPIVKTFTTSASQTFVIHPTAVGTVTLTPTNDGSLTDHAPLTYAAGSSSLLDDTFTGTAGTNLTGHAASPVQFGSQVWGDFLSTFGFPSFLYKAGGGVTTTTGGAAYNFTDLTAAAPSILVTATINSSTTAPDFNIHVHRKSDDTAFIQLQVDYASQHYNLKKCVAGATTTVATGSVTLASGTSYVIRFFLATSGGSTTASATLNGSAMLANTVIADAGDIQLSGRVLMGTGGGAAGDIVVGEFKVDPN